MYQVVILPPAGLIEQVEQFRRLHDPAFHRLPAHVPLLPPFEPVRRDFLSAFDGFRAERFAIGFGEAVTGDHVLGLSVVRGAESLVALRRALVDALQDPGAPLPAGPPSLRIGLFTSDAEQELARRAVGTVEPPPDVEVRALTLLIEDVRGIWHPARERVLT